MSIFCTLHLHGSLEEARACRVAQLRASGDLKLALAGSPPMPIPRHHWPARKEVRGKVTFYVFDEAAPRRTTQKPRKAPKQPSPRPPRQAPKQARSRRPKKPRKS